MQLGARFVAGAVVDELAIWFRWKSILFLAEQHCGHLNASKTAVVKELDKVEHSGTAGGIAASQLW